MDKVVLDNNTQIAGNSNTASITEVVAPPKTTGWAGTWQTSDYVTGGNCLKIDPSSEGSVFPDGGSLGVIYKGTTNSGPGTVVYKKARDRRLHLQFSRDGTGWRKI